MPGLRIQGLGASFEPLGCASVQQDPGAGKSCGLVRGERRHRSGPDDEEIARARGPGWVGGPCWVGGSGAGRQSRLPPRGPAAVQDAHIVVPGPAQHPPGACGGLTCDVVVDDHRCAGADSPGADGRLELVRARQRMAAPRRIIGGVVGELGVHRDVAGARNVPGCEVLAAVGLSERPPDVEQDRRGSRVWACAEKFCELVVGDEDTTARIGHGWIPSLRGRRAGSGGRRDPHPHG